MTKVRESETFGVGLPQIRGRDSWCGSRGALPLGMRIVVTFSGILKQVVLGTRALCIDRSADNVTEPLINFARVFAK